MDEPILDLDDIQGNILPGFRKDSQHFIFARIVDADAAKKWLRELAPRLTSANEARQAHHLWKSQRKRLGHEPDNLDFLFLNCALTATGLAKLGVAVDAFDDDAFKIGLEQRAAGIGDPATPGTPGAPEMWHFGAGARVADVLLILATDDEKWAISSERNLIHEFRQAGMQLIHVDRGRVRPKDQAGHEHFGFKDGISFPALRGRASNVADDFVEPRTLPTTPEFDEMRQRFATPGRPLLWPGHVLFGYPRQERDDPPTPRPHSEPVGPAWAKNGSFLVYRRLNQNVPAFHAFLQSAAADLQQRGFASNFTAEHLGALLVGRWKSGWPYMRHPGMDHGPNQAGENYFTFTHATTVPLPNDPHALNTADPSGHTCPFAAHIRKIQPRDDATELGGMERTLHKAILRRGITFGPELDEPNAERGLLFVAYQSSITDQFEFLMSRWVNNDQVPHANGGFDVILSSRRNTTITLHNGSQSFNLVVPGGWVFATGGAYLFAPGIRFFTDTLV